MTGAEEAGAATGSPNASGREADAIAKASAEALFADDRPASPGAAPEMADGPRISQHASDVQTGVDALGDLSEGAKIYSGWMFASSPALNALQHSVYDIWVIDCKTVAVDK